MKNLVCILLNNIGITANKMFTNSSSSGKKEEKTAVNSGHLVPCSFLYASFVQGASLGGNTH